MASLKTTGFARKVLRMTRQSLAKLVFAFTFIFFVSSAFSEPNKQLSDDEVAKILIQESITEYPGPCACPYNTMKNGRSCGGRSAYSKKGGYAPLCYREDVSEVQIKQWRANHK